ncbi:MAG: hypothetical protein AAF738_02760 [Bacteroidota bacterium]
MNDKIYQLCKGAVVGCAFALLCSIVACQNPKEISYEELLLGKWQATQLMEQDSLLKFDLSAVQLEFFEGNRYGFKGTLRELEAGTYRVQKDLLFTNDTLAQPPHEKVVRILNLTLDSLQLEMLDQNRKRVLGLERAK